MRCISSSRDRRVRPAGPKHTSLKVVLIGDAVAQRFAGLKGDPVAV